jgi:methionyl-tRNA formyltransferase
MRIAIIGQAAFGKAVLEAIVKGGKDEVAGVFAAPDREGRRRDPIVEAADALGLPLFQFKRLRAQEAIDQFKSLEPDLCVMAYVTDIVPMAMIDAPAHGTVQYHPSLLPRHRGPSSINWPIAWGETETGLSIFWPDKGLDTGPLLLQRKVAIGPDDTVGSIYFNSLFPMGVDAMVESIELVRSGSAPRITQDESQATYEGWFKAEEAAINWSADGRTLYNLVRAGDPQPGAGTTLNGAAVSFYDARMSDEDPGAQPGTVLSIGDDGARIAVNGGVLLAGRMRGDGAKVSAREFAEAAGLKPGDRFGV